jgi:Lipase (class 3)
MASKLEYAQLSANVYRGSTHPKNRIGIPLGWREFTVAGAERLLEDPASGFESRAYQNTSTGEIVISYAGTDTEQVLQDILIADGGTGLGFTTAQLKQAAEFYTRVKQAAGGNTISVTGHSLGGGLAALVGVFFDVNAMTFDPAPFRAAAKISNRNDIVTYLQGKQLPIDPMLTSYTTGQNISIPGIIPFSVIEIPTTISREPRVSAVAVQGEFLTGQGQNDIRDKLRIYGAGQYDLIKHGNADTAAVDGFKNIDPFTLHSMALMNMMNKNGVRHHFTI